MAKKTKIEIELEVDDKGTTKKVSQNSQKLGDNLGRTADNAEKVRRKSDEASKSTGELGRNMRGTGQMSSNTTKNFSKMQQGMGGLVAAYATLAAQVFAVSAAFQFLNDASQFRNLIAGQEAMGAVTGTAFKTITASIIEATDAQLKYGDAARAAAIGTAAGLTSGQLTELSTAAKNVSFALGRDLTDSFNRLVRGVTKAEPELLDELGIILRLEPATQKYAQSLGKSVSALNAFERTQAVTNEVLEQAERKFASIEAMMDPSATALAQFTKSFDELMNSFKVGAIELLIPALQFLTKNTTALVAALALVATPILKAILPNLHEWRKQSKELADEYDENANKYKRSIEKQSRALDGQLAHQKKIAKASEKESKKMLAGRDDAASGGLGYLTGASDRAADKGAAKRIINNAQKQLDEAGEITSGKLEGFNQKQVDNFKHTYDQKQKIAGTTNTRIQGFFSRTELHIRKMGNRVLKFWNNTMNRMATAAQVAAVGINAAFSLVAVFGVFTLIIEGFKSLMEYIKPATAEMKAQTKIIEDLTNRYDGLNIEMERATEARRTLVAGSQVQSSAGQSVQAIDVPRLLEDINNLQALDKGSEAYKKLQLELINTTGHLTRINPGFIELAKNIRDGERVTNDQAMAAKNLANQIINQGQEIDSLPEKYKAVDNALAALQKSQVKTSPTALFLKEARTLSSTLRGNERAAVSTQRKQERALERAIELKQEQIALDKEYYLAQADGEEKYANFVKLSESARDRRRAMAGIETVTGDEDYLNIKEITNLASSIKDSRKEAERLTKEISSQEEQINLIQGREEIRLDLAEKMRDLNAIATKSLSHELTILGKINNLEMKRASAEQQYAKALADEQQARTAFILAGQRSGVGSAEQVQMMVAVAAAMDLTDLAKARMEFEKQRIDMTKEDLATQLSILSVQRQIADRERGIEERSLETDRIKTFGPTNPAASPAELRQIRLQDLRDQVANAEDSAYMASIAYLNAERQVFENADRDYRIANKIGETTPLTENQRESVAELAFNTLNAPGGAGAEQQDSEQKVRSAQAALNAEENVFTALVNQNKEKILQMQLDSQNLALSKERIFLEQLLQAAKDKGLTSSEIEIDVLKQQAKAMAEVETQAENTRQLSLTIQSQMEGAFMAMVDGTKSAKQAFADMTRAILADIAKMIIKQMVLNALTSMGMPGFKDGGITSPMSYAGGGYSPRRNYSTGGVARGPQSGYAATLHGNEAIVPLPNSRSIPVEFPQGGPGGNNNVTVNVTMNNDGSSQSNTQGGEASMGTLGNAIAKAVQTELQNQKRAGGILSPYGAA